MPKKIDRQFLITMIILVIIGFFIFTINNVQASIIDELKNRISDRNIKIQELEKEIEQYQKDLDKFINSSLREFVYRPDTKVQEV